MFSISEQKRKTDKPLLHILLRLNLAL